jgi:hypothetical protein
MARARKKCQEKNACHPPLFFVKKKMHATHHFFVSVIIMSHHHLTKNLFFVNTTSRKCYLTYWASHDPPRGAGEQTVNIQDVNPLPDHILLQRHPIM